MSDDNQSIKWLGKIGYGDIISPICHAMVAKRPLDFYWKYPLSDLHAESMLNVNTLIGRFEVTVPVNHHKLDDQFNGSVPFEGIDIKDSKTHNIWLPQTKEMLPDEVKEYVAINTPLQNQVPLDYYDFGKKQWKDPYLETPERWTQAESDILDRGYPLVRVSYRRTLDQNIDTLLKTKMFIGYHGQCAWLARLMGLPMWIMSKDPKWTEQIFPWAVISTHFDIRNLEANYQKSINKFHSMFGVYC
jgi:hypothetical protein